MGNIANFIDVENITISNIERLLSRAQWVGECLEMVGFKKNGYVSIRVANGRFPSHRVIASIINGKDLGNLEPDHLCRNRACIRPAHLEVVTASENIRRGTAWHHFKKLAEKDTCKNGHSLADCLVSVRPSGTVKRACRECHRVNESNRRERIRNGK